MNDSFVSRDVSFADTDLTDVQESNFGDVKNGRLTDEQGVALLRKLTSDAAFKQRFEASPMAALIEIGVPKATLSTLSDNCFATRALASNEVLRSALAELEGGIATECLSMLIPHAKLPIA